MAKKRGRRTKGGGPKKIELRPVRIEAQRVITKLRRVKNPDAKIRRALKAMKECVRHVRMLCGPVMSIPIMKPPRY
jgi:hypothetical protein